MTDLPAPLVPAEVDLSDFQYMELDVRLLRDSKFAAQADAEAFRAGVLLWCAAWHQVPAASLPNNDIELSNLAGYGRVVKEWRKVRDQALALFVLCADGRLYHRVIAEKAVAAWQAKLHHQHGKLLERLRKENKKREGEKLPPLPMPAFDQWNSERGVAGIPAEGSAGSTGIPVENALRGNGEGTERNGTLNSVPDGTAGTPAADKVKGVEDFSKAELWEAGKSLLLEAGVPKGQCGTFVGKLVGDYGNDIVLDAVRSAVVTTPADPREYLKATCMRLKGERAADHGKPITVPSKDQGQTAAWIAEHSATVEQTPEQRAATAERLQAARAKLTGATA